MNRMSNAENKVYKSEYFLPTLKKCFWLRLRNTNCYLFYKCTKIISPSIQCLNIYWLQNTQEDASLLEDATYFYYDNNE